MSNPFRRRITTVGTTIQRVIEDDALPNAVRAGVARAIFQSGDITDHILEELTNSVGIRAERMYRHANRGYFPGMPSGEIHSSAQGRSIVESILQASEVQPILLDYSRFGPPNAIHIAWMRLIAEQGYDEASNTLAAYTAFRGVPVYLHDMEVIYPPSMLSSTPSEVLEVWGRAARAGVTPDRPALPPDLAALVRPTLPSINIPSPTIQIRVTIAWQPIVPGVFVTEQEEFFFDLTGYDLEANYFQAKYYVGGEAKYWIYRDDSGVHPDLDNLFIDSVTTSGDYYPFIYFRWDRLAVSDNPDGRFYPASREASKRLGIDYDLVEDAVHDNPNIAEVEQIFLKLAVPATSDNAVESRYRFDYFDNLFASMGGTGTVVPTEEGNRHAITISDNLFRMALSNAGITKRLITGSIGPIDTYTSIREMQIVPTTNTVTNVFGETITYPYDLEIPVYRYRHQITESLYEELTVRDLQMTYFFFGDYTTTADGDNNILLIPLDRSICLNYSITVREELFSRSLHFVFNSRVVTNLRWYETPLFRAVLLVIAIVITIYSAGAGNSAIGIALGLTGAAGVIASIIINIVIGQLLTAGFQLFVEQLGTDIAIAVAILAILYGGYQIASTGGIANTWASELMSLSTGLKQAVLQDRFQDLSIEATEFNTFVEQQNKLLETGNALLDSRQTLSPFIIFGESPEDFYNRTIHFGNIGTLGLDAIEHYVEVSLRLPKFHHTVGDTFHGQHVQL